MIKLASLYDFMERNFDYVLVVDEKDQVIHSSELFRRDCLPAHPHEETLHLDDLLGDFSLGTFRTAIARARAGSRAIAVFSPANETSRSIPMKVGCTTVDGSKICIFFGQRLEVLSSDTATEKEERIKELSCIYSVMEWIEVSPSINAFFSELPKYLRAGMLVPEDAVVYSIYEGVEWGEKPSSTNYISTRLVVGDKEKGEIRVGYAGDKQELLPEEQRMLNEIGRALNFALGRKEFRDKLTLKQGEEAEFSRRLVQLEDEIAARTRELEEQRQQLGILDSYLDRVSSSMEEAKGRLETMFKAIPDEAVLIDKQRRVIMTNRKDIEPGKRCYEAFFGRDRPCDDCRLARILVDKTPITITMKHDDNFLQVHALPVYNKDDEVDGILEFYRDVTLEKTYEQQLQQADKLASLGQLVSGIGHEINNPNQFIRGNIRIIKQALEDMLPIVDKYQKAHEDLTIARLKYDFFREHIMTLVEDMAHGSERIKNIVEGLRTFARKDEGLLVDTVDMNTMIEASARLVHNEVHKHAEIKLELTENLPTFIGNSQKIEQVLVNLLVNAGQAMSDDKRGLITVRTRAEGSSIIVEIEDDGQGMSEKTLKQIFDPFFTTKRARGGTGLGLAIAYRIIEEHRGHMSVTSELGRGTTITITIPAGKGTQAAVEEKP